MVRPLTPDWNHDFRVAPRIWCSRVKSKIRDSNVLPEQQDSLWCSNVLREQSEGERWNVVGNISDGTNQPFETLNRLRRSHISGP